MSKEDMSWFKDGNVLVNKQATLLVNGREQSPWWDPTGQNPAVHNGPIPLEKVRELFSFPVVRAPMQTTINGELITDPDRVVVAREDTRDVFGVFKSGYQIHQYDEWLVKNVQHLLDDDELVVQSAGLLRKGAVAWVQVTPPEPKETEGLKWLPFILACTSMDGSKASIYMSGDLLVVCDNTLENGINNADSIVRIKHSSRSIGRIGQVRDALGIIVANQDLFSAEMEALLAEEVNRKRWTDFLEAYTGLDEELEGRAKTMAENKRDKLDSMWLADPMVMDLPDSAFKVLQATNTYNRHHAIIRGKVSPMERNMSNFISGKVGEADAHTLQVLASV